jgi:hypothetical protein
VFFLQTNVTTYNGLVMTAMTQNLTYVEMRNVSGPGTGMVSYFPSIPFYTWSHFAWTYSNGTGNTYLNGTFMGSQTGMLSPPGVTRAACYVGYRFDAATGLAGYDEIRIYNRSLNATEIAADYNTASFVNLV